MRLELKVLLSLIVSFIVTMVIAPLVIRLTKRLHAEQSILEYVDNHNNKQGTPTMGGIMFIISIAVTSLIFEGVRSKLMNVMIGVMLGYGLLGFLDDFIKVRYRHNQGLKAYQKIIGQTGIALIVALFAYNSPYIGSDVNIPIINETVDFGWWFIPFTIFILIACTNAVNLTDGLDGLAGSTTAVYMFIFSLVLYGAWLMTEGDVLMREETEALLVFSSVSVGALLAFLWFNSNPAKVFMGDTGSLALGGIVCSIAVFSKNPFLIPIIGIMYIVSCISVIIQVVYFKITKGKRVFRMAPYHHHLQYIGYKESKIVSFYTILTVIAGIVALVLITV